MTLAVHSETYNVELRLSGEQFVRVGDHAEPAPAVLLGQFNWTMDLREQEAQCSALLKLAQFSTRKEAENGHGDIKIPL